MSDCHDETVKRGYRGLLKREPDAGGLAAYAALLRAGTLTEAQFLDSLLHSDEYKKANPPLCGGGPGGPPPPPPPPTGGAIKSLTLSPNKRGFLLNGAPYTIASHGGVVTAIPGHDWRADVALQVTNREIYARLWHWLTGDTPKTATPWLLLPNGKWDLSQFNESYWTEKRAVLEACASAGIVLEVMLFDRGTGGSQSDFKAHPFHPDNNVNGLGGELAVPGDFYALRPKTTALQLAYVQRWLLELRPFPGVIAEVDNECRGYSLSWPRTISRYIKQQDPSRLVSHSSLGSDLEAAYSEPSIDIVCKHFGNEGNSPVTLHSYIATHWKLGKVVNIDEFANGLGDKLLLREMCAEITRNGGHFHIEDSQASADGYGAAAYARSLVGSPPFYEVGPTGPAPACPPELWRGLDFYNALYKGKFWDGSECDQQNKAGFPAGTHIAFDSTPQAGQNNPVPPGCPVKIPTTWTISPNVSFTTDDFGMQATFTKAASYTVTAKGDAGSKSLVVKIV